MISMEMMGKIRRMYFRDKLSLHEIAKRTGLARNTIRKWVRAPEAKQPVYQRRAIFNKLRACELFGHARRRGREWVCDRCGGQMICSA